MTEDELRVMTQVTPAGWAEARPRAAGGRCLCEA
jgi:hypothetical protein